MNAKLDQYEIETLKNRHLGERCFIIGNGPSLKICDLDLLKNDVTFASNKIYLAFDETYWRPTYYTVLDILVAQNNREAINKIRQTKIFPTDVKAFVDNEHEIYWVKGIPNRRINDEIIFDFSTDLNFGVFGGWTVIYTQLQIAYYMGIRKIYLIGVDFHFEIPELSGEICNQGPVIIGNGEQNHFHPNYREVGEKWTVPRLDLQYKAFIAAKNILEMKGGFIHNCSRKTKLDVFPRIQFSTLF